MALFTIPESYVKQFSTTIHMLAEQQRSRLFNTADVEQVVGESFTVERLGNSPGASEITDIGGDTPLNPTPHSRRWGTIKLFEVADILTKESQVQLLIDPRSAYVDKHANAMGKNMDDQIIAALGGPAKEGKEGTTLVQLPANRKVAVGAGAAARLTVEKILAAKRKLDEAEVDAMLPRYFVANAAMMEQLLLDSRIASQDFNTIRALAVGELSTYAGFQFIRSERLKPITGNVFAAYAFAERAVKLGIAQPVRSEVTIRADKRNAQQIYTTGYWGAVRTEDDLVVEIAADVTAVGP